MNPPPSEFRVARSDRICKVCILLKCTDIIHRIWSQGSSCKINIFQAKHLFLRSHINNIVESCFAYLPHVLQAQVHVRSPFRSGKRCFVVVLAFDNLLLLLTSSFSTFICQYIHSSQLRTDLFFFLQSLTSNQRCKLLSWYGDLFKSFPGLFWKFTLLVSCFLFRFLSLSFFLSCSLHLVSHLHLLLLFYVSSWFVSTTQILWHDVCVGWRVVWNLQWNCFW